MIRYNTNLSKFEVYGNGVWASLDTTVGTSGAFENNGNAFGAPAVLGTTDNNTLSLETNGTSRIQVDQLGNVGIGTTSQLYVSGSGYVGISQTAPQASFDDNATDAIIVPRSTAANRPAAGVNGMIRYNTNASKLEAYVNSTWTSIDTSVGTSGAFENNGNAFGAPAILGTTDNNPLSFETNGTTYMTIDALGNLNMGLGKLFVTNSTGNIGVGTTTPNAALDVLTTDAIIVPRSTSVNRPATALNGMIRYNTNLSKFEVYGNGVWASMDTSVGTSGAFENNGNAFGAPAVLGTTDNNTLSFETNGTTYMTIDAMGNLNMGLGKLFVTNSTGNVGVG